MARTREEIVGRWSVFGMSWKIQKHCGEGLEQFELVIVGLERVSGRYVLYKVSIATFASASASDIERD